MVRLPQFINQSGRNTFLDCVQYLTPTEKQQALGNLSTTTIARLRRVTFVRNWSKREEMRLRYGHELSERDRFRYEVLYKV